MLPTMGPIRIVPSMLKATPQLHPPDHPPYLGGLPPPSTPGGPPPPRPPALVPRPSKEGTIRTGRNPYRAHGVQPGGVCRQKHRRRNTDPKIVPGRRVRRKAPQTRAGGQPRIRSARVCLNLTRVRVKFTRAGRGVFGAGPDYSSAGAKRTLHRPG